MRVHSSTVEDVFHIDRRGWIVVPGLLLENSPYVQIGDPATLHHPDGTMIETHIAGMEMFNPHGRNCMPVLLPDDLRRADVPIGAILEITETHIRDNNPTDSLFEIGERVSVVINHRNQTPRRGMIHSAIWHNKYSLWHYYLIDDSGTRIHKRYTSLDLTRRDLDSGTKP